MPKITYNLSLITFFIFLVTSPAYAQNNRMGVHILDPQEISKAASLVNSNGGQWGYVTIPLRANDKDSKKWQLFMDQARSLRVIPIIRLAGVPVGDTWMRPSPDEIIDFSNFLNDLVWPTRTKYIIIFNEPNHSREWGNQVNPVEYAGILDFAIDRFKSLDPNFFILPAALDAAVPDSSTSMSQYRYFAQMFTSFPKLADKIDGLNSHSYPNPGFSGKPTDLHKKSIKSYQHELSYFRKFSTKQLPVFITETGWQMHSLPEDLVAKYYQYAFSEVWEDNRVIAVTPFLLEAGGEDFGKFSLVKSDGSLSKPAQTLQTLPKNAGNPELASADNVSVLKENFFAESDPGESRNYISAKFLSQKIKSFWNTFLKIYYKLAKKSTLEISDTLVNVDIADTDSLRSKGLSGRKPLASNQGMLFTFPEPGIHGFWMKDMLFTLDFIWIRYGKVVQLDENIPYPQNGLPPQTIVPKVPIDSVLEVNGGFVKSHGIQVGDYVSLNN